MKKALLFFGVILFFSCCVKKVDNKNLSSETKKIVRLTEKELFLNSLSPDVESLVSKIDSIRFELTSASFSHNFYIEKKQGETWAIVGPCKNKWMETVYDDFVGGRSRILTFESHLGKAYLEKIEKKETWVSGEKIYTKNLLMKYGILLSPDTINENIFPTGTFVVSKGFLEDEMYEKNQVCYEYIINYNDFEEILWEKIKSVYSLSWVDGYTPQSVVVWL